MNNKKIKKDITELYKKIGINNIPQNNKQKKLQDYKLHNKFPTNFSQGSLTISNSTK